MELTQTKSHDIDLTNGNLFKKLLIVAIPLILSGLLQLLYTAADLIVCNVFGSGNSTGAISSCNALISLLVNTFVCLSAGTNILVSKYFGANKKENAQRVIYTSIILSIVIGIFVAIFGLIFAKYLLILLDTKEELLPLSTQYVGIYFIGTPFVLIYNFSAAILRATGDTKRPFYILLISGILNILLNILFVAVFGLDVAGVAISTVISQVVSAFLAIILLIKHKGFYEFKIKDIKYYHKDAVDILKIGIGSAIQAFAFSLSNVLLQKGINQLSTEVVNGNGGSSSIEGFLYTCMNNVAVASVAFTSANYGAMKKENIKKVMYYAFLIILVFNVIFFIVSLFFGKSLLKLYVKTDEAIEAGYYRLMLIESTYFLCGFMDAESQTIRGINHPLLPSVVTIIGTCLFRIFWVYVIFPLEKFHTLFGIMLSYPISWVLTGTTHFIIFNIIYKKLDFKKTI